KEDHLFHALAVGLFRDRIYARCWTAVDLVQDARPAPILQRMIGAGPQLKVAVDDSKRLSNRAGGGVRAEVARAVALEPADNLQGWVRLVNSQSKADEVLVIPKLDVEARLVLLDQLVLQQQRLLLVAHQKRIQVADQLVQ